MPRLESFAIQQSIIRDLNHPLYSVVHGIAESPDDWLNRAPFLLLLRLEVLECHGQGRKGAVLLTAASASMIVLQYITTLMTCGIVTGFHPRSP